MDLKKLSKNELLNKLEEIREEQGKSKLELAGDLEVSRQTYHRWINGDDKPNDFNRNKIETYLARSKLEEKVEEVGEKFSKTDEIKKTKLVWATLPESRWRELEELEEDERGDIVTQALERYLENEKMKV